MNLDLQNTPIITIVSDQGTANAAKLEEVERDASQAEAVTAARRDYDIAAAHRANLERARNGLNLRVRQLNETIKRAETGLEEALVSQFAEGGLPVDIGAMVNEMLHGRGERTAALLVIEKLVETRIPEASIEEKKKRANWTWSLADEISRVGHSRFEKTSEMLRSASEFENGLCVDVRSTLSGALIARAEALRNQSRTITFEADEAQRKYRQLLSQEIMAGKRTENK